MAGGAGTFRRLVNGGPAMFDDTRGYIYIYIAGWWLSHPSEKYDLVSWGHYPHRD